MKALKMRPFTMFQSQLRNVYTAEHKTWGYSFKFLVG
jgi:hypothetical protein